MKSIKILFIICLFFSNCAKVKIRPEVFQSGIYPDWGMYAGNPARTNVYRGNISLPLKLIWKYDASSAIGETILIVNGIVYFTTLDGRLYALDINTGRKIGHKKLDSDATCVYQDASLFIAYRYGDHTLFKYDLKRARTNWEMDAGDIASEPMVLDDRIIVTALYKHIDLYNSNTGTRIWQTKTEDQIHSSPAIGQGTIAFGCDDGLVYAVKETDGTIRWKFKTQASILATPVIQDTVIYIGSSDKKFYAIDINTGKLLWSFDGGGQILHPAAVDDAVVIFGSTDSHLYCLDRMSGEKLWSFQAKSVISTPPLICHDKVFFGSLDHHYYAVNLNDGHELWQFEAKGRVRTAPVIWGNYLIGASENNYVYCFSTVEEK